VTWLDLFGVAPTFASRADAMSVPAFAKARHIVCTGARLPLREVVTGSGISPQTPRILVQPDPREPGVVTFTWTYDDLLFHGVAWWRVTDRYADGFPRSAERLDPSRVTVDDYRVTVDGKNVPDSDVIRFDGPHEGLLTFGARTIRNGARIEAAAARLADNPVPFVELHNQGADLDDDEIDSLVAAFLRTRATANGAIGYTNAATDLRVHGAPAAELIASERRAVAVDAARLAGLPAASLDAPVDGGTTLSYDNPESRLRELLDFGLSAYTAAVEGRLSMDDVLPHGRTAAYDLTAAGSVGALVTEDTA
jgi:hypothetical protein